MDDTIYIFHPNIQTQKLVDTTEGLNSTEFLADGNFVVPAGITAVLMCICGGGGGGGGGSNIGGKWGGGGGGGAGTDKSFVTVVPAESITITIGDGGSAGGTNGNGGNGQDSVLNYTGGTITGSAGIGGKAGQSGYGHGGAGGSGGGAGGAARDDGIDCSATCSGEATKGGVSPSPSQNFNLVGGGGGGGGYGDGGDAGEFDVSGVSAGLNTGGGGGGGGAPIYGAPSGGVGGAGRCIIAWESTTGVFTLSPVTFTNKPAAWGSTNWPRCGVKFQNRLCAGGAPLDPEEFWLSKSGLPENMDLGTAQPDEAIQHSIDELGAIKWMQVLNKSLVMGTGKNEHVVVSDSGVLKPGDLEVNLQSSYGSTGIKPPLIGDQLMYSNANNRKIRGINYEWQKDNWSSVDLTFPSEHITAGLIKEMIWCQDPNNLLWIVLKNGTACCMTYERGTNVFGWHQHNTQGEILSAASGSDGERDVLIVAVKRLGEIFIEYLTFDYPMDSFMENVNVVSSGGLFYVDGYDHLEGGTVQILVDRATHPNRIVGNESSDGAADGATGRVYLNATADSVVIGLGFDSLFTTLDEDGGSQTGSGLAHKKRRNKVYVKLLNSGIPLIGDVRGLDRDSDTPMGTPEALFTGDVESTELGWDRISNVTVKQDLPLPLIVLSVYGEIAKNAF